MCAFCSRYGRKFRHFLFQPFAVLTGPLRGATTHVRCPAWVPGHLTRFCSALFLRFPVIPVLPRQASISRPTRHRRFGPASARRALGHFSRRCRRFSLPETLSPTVRGKPARSFFDAYPASLFVTICGILIALCSCHRLCLTRQSRGRRLSSGALFMPPRAAPLTSNVMRQEHEPLRTKIVFIQFGLNVFRTRKFREIR